MEKWMSILKTVDKYAFYIAYAGFALYGGIIQVVEYPGTAWFFLYLGLMCLFAGKICIQGNSWKEWLLSILLLAIGLLSYRSSENRMVLLMMLAICSTKNIEIDRLVKMDLAIRIFIIAFLVATPLLGLATNHVGVLVGGRARTYFGWESPNGMGQSFLMFCIDWLYVRWRKWRWYDYAGILVLVAALDVTANSRTPEIIMLFLVLLMLVLSIPKFRFVDQWKLLYVGTAALLVLTALLPVIGVLLEHKYGYWTLLAVGGNFGVRFGLVSIFLGNHGVTLFGAPISGYYEYLDMLFARAGLHLGIVVGIAVFLLLAYGIFRAYQKRDEKFTFLLMIMLLYGVMESEHLNLIYSFFPVLMGYQVYNSHGGKVS